MRTIMINTLGAQFQPSDLFFRAFRDADLVWLNADFASVAACAEKIDRLRSRENKIRDYHLVVLADLSQYQFSVYEKSRVLIRELLAAHLVKHLLPELEARHDLPCSISMIGLCTRDWAGKTGTENYLKLLDLMGEPETVAPGLQLMGDPMQKLELSGLFAEQVKGYQNRCRELKQEAAPENGRFDTSEAAEQYLTEEIEAARRSLAVGIVEELGRLESYRAGSCDGAVLQIKTCEFTVTDFEEIGQAYVDLQINLAVFVQKLMENKNQEPDLTVLCPHSAQELAELFAAAGRRIDTYLNDAAGPGYLALEVREDSMQIGSLRGALHDALRDKAADAAGVQEYLQSTAAQTQNPADGMQREMKKAWLRYREEKERFEEAYNALQAQYDPATVRKEERKILEACAGAFSQWRRDVRDSSAQKKNKLLPERPELPPSVQSEADAAVQKGLLNGELEKLEGYEDVRQQAQKLRGDFERASRLWGPVEGSNAVAAFRRMTLIFAVIAVVVMLLPYVVMTWSVEGLFTPKTLALAVSAGIFAFLYFCAVLLWLWKVCSDMRACTDALEDLTKQSRARRQQSIADLVELYAQQMPQCMKNAMIRECLEQIDRSNEERAAQYHLHRCYLKEARDELEDLRTALHLPEVELPEPTDEPPRIEYALAPYAPANQPCYLLFGGKEEGE